jgi:hypothetical protein
VGIERALELALFHDPDGNELYLAEPAWCELACSA